MSCVVVAACLRAGFDPDTVDFNDFHFDFLGLLRDHDRPSMESWGAEANRMAEGGKIPRFWSKLAQGRRLAIFSGMSRRSRNRGASTGSRFGMVALVFMGVVAVGLGCGHLWLRQYLHSEKFRIFLSQKVGEALKVNGAFSPFRWDGLAVNVSEYRATGEEGIRRMEIEDLRTEVGLGGFTRGVWEVQGFRIRRLDLELYPGGAAALGAGEVPMPDVPKRPKEKQRWLPTEVELQNVDVNDMCLRATLPAGEVQLSGVAVHAEPAGSRQVFDIKLMGGTLALPYPKVPELHLERAKLRCQKDRIFLNQADMRFWDRASLDAVGEFDLEQKRFAVQGNILGVQSSEVLTGDWVKRVTGELSTDYQLVSNDGEVNAKGHLVLKNGVLTALPLLDTLAAYTDTRRFRVLTLSEAHTDWAWKKDELQLTNLVLAAEGLLRLEGSLAVRGRELDGNFRLGISPGSLASIPGAETDVFLPGENGLLWAPIRITGTLDDPKQDLKERLVMAAGTRLFTILPETGVEVLKYSGRALGDSSEGVLKSGKKLIKEGGDVIEGAGSLLHGLIRGRDKKE